MRNLDEMLDRLKSKMVKPDEVVDVWEGQVDIIHKGLFKSRLMACPIVKILKKKYSPEWLEMNLYSALLKSLFKLFLNFRSIFAINPSQNILKK